MAIAVATYWERIQAGAAPVEQRVNGYWHTFQSALEQAKAAAMQAQAVATVATPMYAQPVLIRYDETTG